MKPQLPAENASHEGTLEAEILRCDVAIVGGGIAGIACAERLAREAWRQRKRLRIVVIEQRDKLGAAASRRLEGWYHTGALYSNLDDPRRFTYFLFAFEDLYNWYHYDRAFPFWANCNLSPITAERPRPGYDFLGPQASRWFVDEIAYIMPREPAAQTPSYAARRSRSEWESAAARAKWLVANTFYRCSWQNGEFGCAQAPHLRANPDSHGDFEIPRDLINESFEDVLAACFSGQDSSGLGLALGELARRRDELEEVTREIQTSDQIVVDVMPSRDAVMDTYRILHDLVCAAAGRGVKFLTDCRLDFDSVQIARTSAQVQGLKVCKSDGKQIHVIADQYVFALGSGFDEADFLRKTLGIRVRIEKTISVMVVACPSLPPHHSFARLDHSPEHMVNHICRRGGKTPVPGGYSIIADANGLAESANPNECYDLARTLLGKAEKICGEGTKERHLGWYSCLKTEGISLEGSRREYSYWLEPRLEYDLISGVWTTAKDTNQKGVQEQIKQSVMRPGTASPDLPAPIEHSGWALGKSIHFALQRLALACAPGQPGYEEARRDFETVRNRAIAVFQEHFDARRAVRPNYICIIPGKFSLFPTLAHQVYIEMEVRGLFKHAREALGGDAQAPDSPPPSSLPPNVVVARPLAVDLLSGESECAWPIMESGGPPPTNSSDPSVGPDSRLERLS